MGDPAAPPLLLVHGARDHCRSWDWMAKRLGRDFHVIAPDLRGHGDSQWVNDGVYSIDGYIGDLARLVDLQTAMPVSIVAHSLGGRIALRYAGIYPEKVARLVAIEGLGPPPSELARQAETPIAERMRNWIDACRAQGERPARRFASIDAAAARMAEQNPGLTEAQVRHLALWGVRQNEDGSYGWKFDGRVRVRAPLEMSISDMESLWMRIACPLLLIHGSASFLPDPRVEQRDRQFRDARLAVVEGGSHWSHHDHFDEVAGLIEAFLAGTASAAHLPSPPAERSTS